MQTPNGCACQFQNSRRQGKLMHVRPDSIALNSTKNTFFYCWFLLLEKCNAGLLLLKHAQCPNKRAPWCELGQISSHPLRIRSCWNGLGIHEQTAQEFTQITNLITSLSSIETRQMVIQSQNFGNYTGCITGQSPLRCRIGIPTHKYV